MIRVTMGSSWALVCATALHFVLLSAAVGEIAIEQREISLDIDHEGMLQKEVDWRELFDLGDPDFEGQRIVDPPLPGGFIQGGLNPRGHPPSFWPRSHRGPPALDYPVEFPLGRPTSDNLQAICNNGEHRPRYPDSYFPSSGFGKQVRMANAVNHAESWFSTCCQGNQTWEQDVTLCCATQAWAQSVKLFCEEDSSVKNRVYHCCHLRGTKRENCFHEDAKNKDYAATEELPVSPVPTKVNFNFDPNSCQRTVMTQRTVTFYGAKKRKTPSTPQKAHVDFPPGRPTADNIESVCQNQKLRPLFNVKCLSGARYKAVALQAKTINRIEKGFKKCCKKKKDVLNCADKKWSEELNKFCMVKTGEQQTCCTDDRYNCFQLMSPDPFYNKTSADEEHSLGNVCDTHQIIKKRFPVGFPLKTFVSQCCPLPEQNRNSCSAEQVEKLSVDLCVSGRASSPPVSDCCDMPSQEIPQCISKILMDAIAKASNASLQKKKKRCPLS
ncbi:extracellular matrix protein 1-like [Mugil cephalus]|uniref:extracellular matrix protein 1-like n=1 Tax=Mugil cephalus TaxID=48193 RepID=UPI001FB5A4B3|nr:extracellular matrix protein 1-like [Mugil cephalus]